MSKNGLSKRQQKILTFIREYSEENDRPPTIREIGKAAKISSTSVVNYNLTRLKEKGFVEREAEVSRGLKLTRKAFVDFFGEKVQAMAEEIGKIIRIPLAGDIVASAPIMTGSDGFATYDDEDAVEVSSSMLPSRVDDLFALRVRGDSMIDAMVNDGDIVIMRQDQVARDGEMVAVLIENETTTLKHFYREGKQVRLQPANPTMDPIFVPADQVQVQGKVVMVVRQTP